MKVTGLNLLGNNVMIECEVSELKDLMSVLDKPNVQFECEDKKPTILVETDRTKAIQAIKNATIKNAANKKLEWDNKRIVEMHDKENQSFVDIAKVLGCSPQTVANRYHKLKGEE